MTISLLDYTSKATVSLDRDRSQQVSVMVSLRELPKPRSEEILKWPDVYVASHLPCVYEDSHLLAMQLQEEMGIPSNGGYGPFDSILGEIYSEIRKVGTHHNLARMIGINIWDFTENVRDGFVTLCYMRMAAFDIAMAALLGVDVLALRHWKYQDKRCNDFSLHELEIRKADNMDQQSASLVDLKELVRLEKEERGKP